MIHTDGIKTIANAPRRDRPEVYQYGRIAAVFAGDYATCTTDEQRRKVVGIALSLSDVFAQGDPRFNRYAWLSACHLINEGYRGLGCNRCGAGPGEPCDAGLHS